MKDKITTTRASVKNPYKDLYIWMKGELLDILGISEALIGRETVYKQQL